MAALCAPVAAAAQQDGPAGCPLQARDQPADSQKYGSLENTTLFGVAAQASKPRVMSASRLVPLHSAQTWSLPAAWAAAPMLLCP